MNKIAHIISAIFSPLLVPTYGVALTMSKSILFIVPDRAKLSVTAISFFITALIPAIIIFILLKTKTISDAGLNKRSERPIPYVVTTVCYVALALYLNYIHAPIWFSMFIAGAAAATIISTVVNLWWKISAHGAAMGGLVALIYMLSFCNLAIANMTPWLYGAIIATGLVGTSRLILERHTLMQVICGVINGFVCVVTAMTLIF